MHSARRLLLAFLSLLALGFDWPSRAGRAVSALTAAETPRDRRDALRRIEELDSPRANEAVRALLANSDAEVRAEALRLFGRVADDATGELIAACADQAPEVRVVAIRELGRRALPAHIQLLLRGAADPEPRVRSASLQALTSNAEDAAFTALMTGLSDSALDVRAAAVRGLAMRPEPEARQALLHAFEGALPELRSAILDAVGGELASRAGLSLAVALDDPDEQVVLAALRSYARSNAPPPSERVAALTSSPSPQIAAAATRLLARTSASPPATSALWLPALEVTAQRLSDEQSAATLGELERTLPSDEVLATDPLLEWLARAPVVLRPRIVALIERSAGEVRTSAVAPLLAEADATLRSKLLGLLARADDAASSTLERALDDPAPEVRAAAGRVLSGRLDQPRIDRLAARLRQANTVSTRGELTRIFADGLASPAQALGPAQHEELCELLTPRRTDDVRIASLQLRALGAVDHACARARIHEALRDPRRVVLVAALRASVRDHGEHARALRQEALDHPDGGIAAMAVIAATLASDVLELAKLHELIERAHWPLRPAVAFALASLRDVTAFSRAQLCALRDSREPATRSNALVALSRAAGSCPNAPEGLLATSRAWPVRHAAAMLTRTRAQRTDAQVEQAALTRCREREQDVRVRLACAGVRNRPVAPPSADRARALVLQDARVLISLPDGSGDVAWPDLEAIADLPAWFAPYIRE